MRDYLTADCVRSVVDYAPETGSFAWRKRDERYFNCNAHQSSAQSAAAWNAKFAGHQAGYINSCGYRQIVIFNIGFLAHRLAWLYMTGEWPSVYIDHINGIRHDNRWANLREATHAQNLQNRKAPTNNTSGAKGVSWHRNKWRVQIGQRPRKHIGCFDSIEEAKAAYARAAHELYGCFARAE